MWLTRFDQPLDVAVAAAQDPLPGLEGVGHAVPEPTPEDDASCDNGACWT